MTGASVSDISMEQDGLFEGVDNAARFSPLARSLRDSITLKLGIRMCAAFNAGGLFALVGYVWLLVGPDRLGVNMDLFVPMVAAFTLGLIFAGLATLAWFGSLQQMAQAGAIAMDEDGPADVRQCEPYRRGFNLQFWTTSLVVGSYAAFMGGLAGLPMFFRSFGG
jgi:hypothetical protein